MSVEEISKAIKKPLNPGLCDKTQAQIPLGHPVELFARPTPSDLIDFPQDAQSSTWHPTPLLLSLLSSMSRDVKQSRKSRL